MEAILCHFMETIFLLLCKDLYGKLLLIEEVADFEYVRRDVDVMTLQQRAINIMEHLPDEKLAQVIQFAEFLSANTNASTEQNKGEEGYIRKPGILKQKLEMADDFDAPLECFKEYM